jgi:3-oxoacyl-[acyl-carrier protein] reductase
MLDDLSGKVVLITGASSGIGAALAEGFGAVGSRVAVHYRSNERDATQVATHLQRSGVDTGVFQADLGKRGAGDALVRAVLDQFGVLDVLVNNAGTMVARRASAEIDDDYFDEVLSSNFYSMISCTRAALPGMVARRTGSIVNMTSVAARNGGSNGAALYGAAKAAVSTYTRGLAKEVASAGVRINALSPGVVATRFHERFSTPESFATLVSAIPMGRAGAAADLIGPALFLASNAMSGYVTGQILEVNGGLYSP